MSIETTLQPLAFRRTKIVATLGPRSDDDATIRRLIDAGADVFRLNMSHGTQEQHRRTHARVVAAAAAAGRMVATIADLCGPKIRVGQLDVGRIDLREGETVVVTTRDVIGGPGLIPTRYAALADDVADAVGSDGRILLDDGNLELAVQRVEGTEITCRVVAGGVLKERKGINLPGVAVSAPALTDKDIGDAHFALELGVDALALSFVRRAADVLSLRALIGEHPARPHIISKIEKPEALEDIRAIMDASDAIMVARGDLGVELRPELVPLVQDQLIDLARNNNVPVIVATQMLESMMHRPRPTRAEVSDVANAVRCGADAIMLSGETAAGAYPVEAVEMMDTVARQTEAHLSRQGAFRSIVDHEPPPPPRQIEDAVAAATAQLSRDLRVRSIVVITRCGRSAAVTSASRPAGPIVAVCPNAQVARRTNLQWGVRPVVASEDEMHDPKPLARRLVRELDLASPGDRILVVRGFNSDPELNAPSVTVVTV